MNCVPFFFYVRDCSRPEPDKEIITVCHPRVFELFFCSSWFRVVSSRELVGSDSGRYRRYPHFFSESGVHWYLPQIPSSTMPAPRDRRWRLVLLQCVVWVHDPSPSLRPKPAFVLFCSFPSCLFFFRFWKNKCQKKRSFLFWGGRAQRNAGFCVRTWESIRRIICHLGTNKKKKKTGVRDLKRITAPGSIQPPPPPTFISLFFHARRNPQRHFTSPQLFRRHLEREGERKGRYCLLLHSAESDVQPTRVGDCRGILHATHLTCPCYSHKLSCTRVPLTSRRTNLLGLVLTAYGSTIPFFLSLAQITIVTNIDHVVNTWSG